jgi:branched-chain amino acid transport system substrate-binding protein
VVFQTLVHVARPAPSRPAGRFLLNLALLASLALVPSAAAGAEVGVGPRTILVGQSAAFSGPAGLLGREFREGAHEVFDQVNAQGGIHGRQVVMVYRDDRYDPDLARRNTEELINREKVFTLFGYVGTPTLMAALPLLQRHGMPLVAPVTGAQVARMPLQPLIFNIRASYHQEMEAIVRYLLRYGRRDIAIVYQNDAYGQDGLRGAQLALQRRGLQPVLSVPVARQSTDNDTVARRVALARPDAVVIVSAYGTAASFIGQLRRHGSQAQVLNLSFVGSNALASALPPSLRHGVGISQVVPFPWDARIPVVRDYQNTIRRNRSQSRFGFSSLEGYLAATVLVKALEAAGPDPTRARFIQAMESLGTLDLGGYRVRLSPTNHNGGDLVQLTFLVGDKGAFIH